MFASSSFASWVIFPDAHSRRLIVYDNQTQLPLEALQILADKWRQMGYANLVVLKVQRFEFAPKALLVSTGRTKILIQTDLRRADILPKNKSVVTIWNNIVVQHTKGTTEIETLDLRSRKLIRKSNLDPDSVGSTRWQTRIARNGDLVITAVFKERAQGLLGTGCGALLGASLGGTVSTTVAGAIIGAAAGTFANSEVRHWIISMDGMILHVPHHAHLF